MNWFDPNFWSAMAADAQRNMAAPWLASLPMIPGFASMHAGDESTLASAKDGLSQVNELIKRTFEGWTKLAQTNKGEKTAAGRFDSSMLKELFDPSDWSSATMTGIDVTLQRLTEAPTLATPTNVDRKVLNAQRLWLQRAKDIQAYQLAIQAAWTRAFVSFPRPFRTRPLRH